MSAGVRSDGWEVYALRYAERVGSTGQAFIFDDLHDAPLPMDYFVWALVNGPRVIVVDTGFDEAEARSRQRQLLRHPVDALANVGVDAAKVENVVVTHMHYDHAGTLDRFPNARFHLQDQEMAYVTGRSMRHRVLRYPFAVEHVVQMVRLVHDDRVEFHDGAQTIAPGVSVHHVGGHTRGLQVVRVETRRGVVVLASDAAHYYANMERSNPFPIVDSVSAMLEGHRTVHRLADSPAHVVPGHDPKVMAIYPSPAGLAPGLAASLHEPPRES